MVKANVGGEKLISILDERVCIAVNAAVEAGFIPADVVAFGAAAELPLPFCFPGRAGEIFRVEFLEKFAVDASRPWHYRNAAAVQGNAIFFRYGKKQIKLFLPFLI